MTSEIETACKEINAGNNIDANWDRLSELSLTSVILFNRRRQGKGSQDDFVSFSIILSPFT